MSDLAINVAVEPPEGLARKGAIGHVISYAGSAFRVDAPQGHAYLYERAALPGVA